MSPGRGRGTEVFLSNRCSDPVPEGCHPQKEAGMDRHSIECPCKHCGMSAFPCGNSISELLVIVAGK